LVLNDP
ncbi:hypothetical protein E2320_007526, partial [Naja naja]